MPTYVCTTRTDALDDAKRSAIAAAISGAHSGVTDAPTFFVQVIFGEADAGRRFLGGTAADDHVWIRGDIRAGRTIEARMLLMQTIVTDVAEIMGLEDSDIWVYLDELEPADMIEYGHVLPAPGEENAWFENLPETLRTYLEGLGAGSGSSVP